MRVTVDLILQHTAGDRCRCPSRSAMAVLSALEHRSCACTIGSPEAAIRDSGGPWRPAPYHSWTFLAHLTVFDW
jgi:hypothetical protein